MKKLFSVILALTLAFTLAACGQSKDNVTKTAARESVTDSVEEAGTETSANSEETQNTEPVSETAQKSSGILIAYFTWADNTVVESPNEIDVDATTSASVLAPGNAAKIAGWIQSEIGGDLFSIKVEEPYSSDYDECLDRAADEKADQIRPALSSHIENMEEYDTVFIGYPNWWYTCPMAIFSFIEEYDLSEKNIVLFCTHGTGGLASSVEDITAALPESCTVSENVLGVYRPDVDTSEAEVKSWIQELELF